MYQRDELCLLYTSIVLRLEKEYRQELVLFDVPPFNRTEIDQIVGSTTLG